MDREEIIRMAREAGLPYIYQTGEVANLRLVERFAALVAAAERNKLAAWMIERGYATGHGDTVEDLLKELEWQIAEREREVCAKVCDVLAVHPEYASDITKVAAQAIRARGEK
jgi:2-oxo-4-hydroxy-4-carboxy--5-ureidoimidazoline (OHCU) decarboxylase